MTIILKSSVVSTNPDLSLLRRDPILDDDNDGVKFMFDLGFDWGYPAGTPVDGQLVRDLTETADGDVDIVSGQSISRAGGGLDFTGLTHDPACVQGPAGCLASIHAGSQYFMVVGWFKLPSSGDWNTSLTIAPMFCSAMSGGGYTSGVDLLTIAQGTPGTLSFRRQTNGGSTTVQLNPATLTDFYGKVCQIAFWRNAAGTGYSIRSVDGLLSATAAVGIVNSGDFSATQPKWGVPDGLNTLITVTEHRLAHKTRLYRGWVEDLEISGRDPVAVLARDWDANFARFS